MHWGGHLGKTSDWGPPSLLPAGLLESLSAFSFHSFTLLLSVFFTQSNFHSFSQCMLADIDATKKSLSM